MMSKERIATYTIEEARTLKDETGWARLEAEEAAGIEPAHDPDIDDLDIDWTKARWVDPAPKKAISLRLDSDVLEFFKAQGKGYQTRMNAVLRAYMEAQRR
jgi:uncharacterized protein (DUF4415 family)